MSVRGLVIKEAKVLLVHRFKNGSEYWVVPGGGVEEGESKIKALVREMWEETSQKVISFTFLKSAEVNDKEHFLYECELSSGELKMQGPEAKEENEGNKYILTWVPVEQAKKLETLYPEIVKDYL